MKTVMEGNVTDNAMNITIEELNAIETNKYIGVLIFCEALMIIGIFGNVLVLIVYKVKFKRSSARTYILALAVADLSVCLIGIPYHALDLTMLLVYKYKYLCKTMSFLLSACTQSSVLILLAVGLDRFLRVVRPLKKQIVDYVGDIRACIIAAAVGIVLSVPNAILYGPRTVSTDIEGLNGVECFIDDSFVKEIFTIVYLGLILVIFFVSFLYLIVIYACICIKIRRQDTRTEELKLYKRKTGFTQSTARYLTSHSQNKKNHSAKITLMMLIITIVYVLSYLPITVLSVLTAVFDDFWESMGRYESILSDLALRLYLINNVANPIVYSFWDLRFRKECLALLRCLWDCRRKSSYNITTGSSSSSRRTAMTESS